MKGMKPFRFVVLAAIALGASWPVAFLVSVLGAVPLLQVGTMLGLIGVPPGMMLVAMVMRWSHCRSVVAGVLVGIAVGGFIVVEANHFRMVRDLGREAKGRYDAIPRYLQARMENTHYVPLGSPREMREATPSDGPMDTAMNWLLWVLTNGGLLLACMWTGGAMARRPWCPHCRHWKARERIVLPIETLEHLASGPTTEGLRTALAADTKGLPDEMEAAMGMGRKVPTVALHVDYCDRDHRRAGECEVHMSADFGPAVGIRRRLFKRMPLSAEQVRDVAGKIRAVG